MRSIILTCLFVFLCASPDKLLAASVIYRNPRVYNVEYSFEMFPDPNKIDRSKDLKLWVPIPREWDSQKSVKIISVEPEPHARYADPEYGNPMLFWDFGKEPEKPSYKVTIKYRLEQYEVYADIDPNQIGHYDKTNKDYILYTQSTHTININDKVRELAQIAIGDEKNPYPQAKRIYEFVIKKMGYEWRGRSRSVEDILRFPVTDPKTGEQYYEGECFDYSLFFVALCRAIGIPARTVQALWDSRPGLPETEVTEFPELSVDGLARSRALGGLAGHGWAEFYLPNYGWIPVDPAYGGWCRLGWYRHSALNNKVVIIGKGRDIQIGPNAPEKQSKGYGNLHLLVHEGRCNLFSPAVWNIAKIYRAAEGSFAHPDPFPADALAEYSAKLYPETEAEHTLAPYRKDELAWVVHNTRGRPDKIAALAQAYKKEPRARYEHEAFICHILRKVVGDENFFKIYDAYVNLRVSSCEPVSTERFQKIAEDIYGKPLDWFFGQWVGYTELPQLKIDAVTLSKDGKERRVRGNLRQLNDTLLRLAIELALETEKTTERKTIWLEERNADFEFITPNKPKKIVVDPNDDILKIQEVPPRLTEFWIAEPDIVVIYGTVAEGEENKAAAQYFEEKSFDLDENIVKADVDVNEIDLKTKCIILFGRPETNNVAQKFESILPIKFSGAKFTWAGKTYDKPTQGVAQIAENPDNPGCLVIMYAGLSGEATKNLCDLQGHDAAASYVVFDRNKELLRGDWRVDNHLVWDFDDRIVGY